MYKLNQISKIIFDNFLKNFDENKILIDDSSKYNDDIKNGNSIYLGIFHNNEIIAVKKITITTRQKIFHSITLIKKKYRGKNIIRDLCMYLPIIMIDNMKIINDNTIHFTMSLGRREKLWLRRGWKTFKHYEMKNFTEITNEQFLKYCKINSNNVITICYISHLSLKKCQSYINILNNKDIYYDIIK